MDFRLLGPLEVVHERRPLPLGGPQQRLVLAHLVLQANQLIPAERLIDAVWAEQAPPAARGTLQVYVSRLRKQVGAERLRCRAGGYVLQAEPHEIDVARFELLVEQARSARTTDPDQAAAIYAEALACWRGAVDDLDAQIATLPEVVRLETLRLAALEERIDVQLMLGRHTEVIAELEILTGAHPLREHLWSQQMVALYRCGQQGAALRTYQRARRTLGDELGMDPSPELQRLHLQILHHERALESFGVTLRAYRLIERLGQGAFGMVFRGRQTHIGRDVAVRVIHPRFANDPSFVRRFEAEAQVVARLEHPHIVPVYDYWREPGGAYLVMRYLAGGSLRRMLADGPLDADTTASIVDQIAPALDAAHRQWVVHRDIRPENLLFDEDGNAYLSDFANLAARQTGTSATAATDICHLGLVAHEMLAGRLSRSGPPSEEVPADVANVIDRATSDDPNERHPDASSFADDLRSALLGARHPTLTARAVRNPYKGLRAFAEADAGDFFGREQQVERLVGRLAERRSIGAGSVSGFLAVVGPSGSGKSSLVRAGLLPALRAGAVDGSRDWFLCDMHPGADPFAAFRSALRRVAARPLPSELTDDSNRAADLISRAASWALPGDDAELLLVIDQFEELFTLVGDERCRSAFLACLEAAVTTADGRVRVVVTVRADFYGHLLADRTLADLVRLRTEALVPMHVQELERAVAGPAERVGASLDPALVTQIVADVTDQPGALPLLQYALTELFDAGVRARSSPAVYHEVGGIAGALARRADRVLEGLSPAGRAAARRLFLQLITLGEGTEDTRCRVLRHEIVAREHDPAAVNAAIKAFGNARLLTFDRHPETRQPTIEVAHEALIRVWGQLHAWVEAAREDLRSERQLAAATRDWSDAGRDSSFLLSGSRLDRFVALVAHTDLALTPDEHALVTASVVERDRRRDQFEAQAARERALERRSVRRLRGLLAVFAMAALVAGGLSVRLSEQVQLSTARELAAAAVTNLDVDPERSILLALEAVTLSIAPDGTVLREAEESLRQAVRGSRLVRTMPQEGPGLAVSAEGSRMVTSGGSASAPRVTVWDTASGDRVHELAGRAVGGTRLAFSPDDRSIVTTDDDGAVRLYDATNGEEVRSFLGHDGALGAPAFSADGRHLVTGGVDGTVRIWDVSTGEQRLTISELDHVPHNPMFTPDGARVAIAAPDGVVFHDAVSGEVVGRLDGLDHAVRSVAFHPDGQRVATAGVDGIARIWDLEAGTILRSFRTPSFLDIVIFDRAADRIATGGHDGLARVWDVETGEQLLALAGHVGNVVNLAFTRDGEGLFTSGQDRATRMWDIGVAGARDWLTVPGATGIFTGVAFSPDGSRFAAPVDPAGVAVWDALTGTRIATLTGGKSKLTAVSFSPDGLRLVASSDLTPSPMVWEVETGRQLLQLVGHTGGVRTVAYAPDGRNIATGGHDGTVRLWDPDTGEEAARVSVGGEEVFTLAWSPDAGSLAMGGVSGEVEVWDARTFELQWVMDAHAGAVEGLAFAGDRRLVTSGGDALAKIWELGSAEDPVVLRGHQAVISGLDVSPDASTVATASDDGTTRLWDPVDGRELLTLSGHSQLVFGVSFSPDGRLLATASPDGTVALHLLPIDEFTELVRERLTRDLTQEECRQYLRLPACPSDGS
jgi:WD40 repeat protein/DNA-binding SARP family transcriptional activator